MKFSNADFGSLKTALGAEILSKTVPRATLRLSPPRCLSEPKTAEGERDTKANATNLDLFLYFSLIGVAAGDFYSRIA